MKTNSRGIRVALLICAALAWASVPLPADPGSSTPVVRVEAAVDGQAVRIEASGTAPIEFTSHKPTANVFVVDFAGVAETDTSGARVLDSPLVSSYRIVQLRGGERPIVRLEILLRQPVQPQFDRPAPERLSLVFAAPRAERPASLPEPRTEPALEAATAIQDIHVTRVGEQTHVRIAADGKPAYEALRLSNPERLVLDFAGARPRVASRVLQSSWSPVASVRVAEFKPGVTRVVVDLSTSSPYQISAEGRFLTVVFGTSSGASRTPSAPASGGESELADLGVSRLSLPEMLTRRDAGLARPAQQQATPEAARQPEEPGGEPAPSAQPQPAPSAAPSRSAPSPVPAQGGRYSGEPISVNLKDVDLKDFFRLIHEISGLNVVLDPSVRGSLTIVLDDVPWDQALDIVLKNNNLDRQLEGNVLRVATRDTLKKEAEALRDLAKAQAEAVPQVTTTRVLSYAKASAITETLKKFLSPRGEILADERSNTLIIRDIPSVLPDIDNLIAQLDRKSQQVEIEGRVVAASRNFFREIGNQLGFVTSYNKSGSSNLFGGLPGVASPLDRSGGGVNPPPPLVVADTDGNIPLNVNLGATVPTSGFSYFHTSSNLALDLIISAAETRGVGKLLSKPKVITQNNEKAIVKQGTKIPVQTIINNTISVQFIDAVLKLEVTPQITAEGTVFMDVMVENTAIDDAIPRVQGIPALNTQATETKITVADGGTFVIGGVIISSQRTDIAQVPLIGSIPVIGHLFKRTTVNTQSQELLFFLTPRILPN
jgi:type IV pilus secretin PilQ/predicted competence protein